MVPLQIQNQICHTDTMIRCEGCGVILTPESPEGLARAQEEGERIERALKASTEQRDAERAAVSEAVALEQAEESAAKEATAAALAAEVAVEYDSSDEFDAEAPSGEEMERVGASWRPWRAVAARGAAQAAPVPLLTGMAVSMAGTTR